MNDSKIAPPMDRPIDVPHKAASKRISIPLWLAIAGFLLLIALRDIIGVHVPRTLYTVYLGICFLLVKDDSDLALLLCVIPFCTKVSFNEITLIFLVVYVFRRFQSLSLPSKALPFLLVLVIELADVLLTSGDLMQYFRFAVVMLISMFILLNPMKKERVATMMLAYSFSVFCVQLDIAYNTFTNISLQELFDSAYRFGYINHGEEQFGSELITSFNPNMLGFFSAAAVYCVFILLYTKVLRPIIGVPMLATILFFGLLTQSRSMAVALIVFTVSVLVFRTKSVRHAIVSLILAVLIILIFSWLMQGPLSGLYDRYFARFTEEDVTNGRIGIWMGLLSEQLKNPLKLFFGFGIRSYADLAGGGASAHNVIMEILLSWGVFGLVAIIAWVVNAIKIQAALVEREPDKRVPLIYFAPIIAFLVHGMSEHIFTVNVFTIVMSLMILSIRAAGFEDRRLTTREERRKEREAQKERKAQKRRASLRRGF